MRVQHNVVPAPLGGGLQQFKFQIYRPASPKQWLAFSGILMCRCCMLLVVVYTVLVLASLLTSPFGFCATITGRCTCSCEIAMPGNEWQAFYHPAANTLEVKRRSVRPSTVDDTDLCGVCEASWPACREAAEAQGYFPHTPVHSNISTWLTCYTPACVTSVRAYYGPTMSKTLRGDPDTDACEVARAIDGPSCPYKDGHLNLMHCPA